MPVGNRVPARRWPAPRAAAVLLAAGVGFAPGAAAGPWSFSPVVTLSAQRTDNAGLVATADAREAATVVTADLLLPLGYRGRRDDWILSYRPVRETYRGLDSVPSGALDNTAHYAAFSWTRRRSERSRWELRTSWSRADRARLALDAPEADLVALPRTKTDTLTSRLAMSARTGPRSEFSASVAYHATSFDRPEASVPGSAAVPLADSSTVTVEGTLGRDVTRTQRLSLGYRGSRIDEGLRGEVDVHRLLAGWSGGRPEAVGFTVAVGISRTEVRRAAPDDPPGLDGDLGFVGTALIRARLPRQGEFSGGVTRDVGASGGTGGPSETTAVHAGLLWPTGKWSKISFAGRWTDRSPLGADRSLSPPTRTTALGGEWHAALGETTALVLSVEQMRQTTTAGLTPLEVDYRIWGFGLRWAPGAGR
ncbi:MAG: hypothetical protein D6718_05165 [Acidobacteria bacterium]|nr:MAG: hypothetical protein D6718_05165 [Acidobacteriota bacterium]